MTQRLHSCPNSLNNSRVLASRDMTLHHHCLPSRRRKRCASHQLVSTHLKQPSLNTKKSDPILSTSKAPRNPPFRQMTQDACPLLHNLSPTAGPHQTGSSNRRPLRHPNRSQNPHRRPT